MALVGYARVSSVGQSLAVQRGKLKHCEKIFQEKKSGASGSRPRSVQGELPLRASQTWEDGYTFWFGGTIKKFGQAGDYRVTNLIGLRKVEMIEKGSNKFKFLFRSGEQKTVENLRYGIYDYAPYNRAGFIRFPSGRLELRSDGVDVVVPLSRMKSLIFRDKRVAILEIKDGDSGEVSLLEVIGIYGKLPDGHILFDWLYRKNGSRIVKIEMLYEENRNEPPNKKSGGDFQ
jgi:hypothetical protein